MKIVATTPELRERPRCEAPRLAALHATRCRLERALHRLYDEFAEFHAGWRRDDGLLLDPRLRAHERLCAAVHSIAYGSMRISGSRAEWEDWTGMTFPDNGSYVIPGALVPLELSDAGGRYVEPNVWMRHG